MGRELGLQQKRSYCGRVRVTFIALFLLHFFFKILFLRLPLID